MLTRLGEVTRKIETPLTSSLLRTGSSSSLPEPPLYQLQVNNIEIAPGSTMRVCYEDGSSFLGKATVVSRKGSVGVRVDLFSANGEEGNPEAATVMYECLTQREIESIRPVQGADWQFEVRICRELGNGEAPEGI